jgi:translocation and assembly module TamB
MDAGFNEKIFTDACMDVFFQIQGAWANRDMSTAKNVLTDEMYGILSEDARKLKAEKKINRLDIIAVRPNIDARVGVAVTGTLANPRVRLFSEPEMTEIDKLSWLVLGRPSDGLGGTDTALLQRAAVALLAGEDQAPTDQLLQQLGISDFSLRQTEGTTRETIVSLGRQLSQRWYLGYERSVNATTGTWQLIYRVAQRVTVRAQSGVESALDVIWSWRWN